MRHIRTWFVVGMVALPMAAVAADPFVVGACAHFGPGKGLLPANLSMMKQGGVASFRDEVGWRAVERSKGQFEMPAAGDEFVNQALAAGIQPLLILDYGNPLYDGGDKPRSPEAIGGFCRYAEFVVRHFKGRVKLYEVWNEWDGAIGSKTPGSADDYAILIKKVYPRIKAVDRSVTVLGGAPTPSGVRNGWLERLLSLDTLRSMDALSIHTYTYSESGTARMPEAWAAWMNDVRKMMMQKHGSGDAIPLYVTEMGWPTEIDRRGTPPEVSAAYLARLYLLARTMPFLKGIWWYDFQDDGWSATYNEDNFGIVRPDLTPKPAYFSLADIAAVVAQDEFAGRVDTGDPDIWVLRFRGAGARETWAIWSAHSEDAWQVTLETARTNPPAVRVGEVGRKAIQREWGSRDWVGAHGNAPTLPGRLDLTVRGTPWLISGDLDGVNVAATRRREWPESSRPALYLQ